MMIFTFVSLMPVHNVCRICKIIKEYIYMFILYVHCTTCVCVPALHVCNTKLEQLFFIHNSRFPYFKYLL